MNKRGILRKKAKKLYKQQIKEVPKKFRIPFADFFKTYVESIKNKDTVDTTDGAEDFNFDDLINTNEISDDLLEFESDVDINEEE